MAESMDNIEGCQSCDDSSHDKCTLRILTAAMMFTVDVRAGKTVVVAQMCREGALPI